MLGRHSRAASTPTFACDKLVECIDLDAPPSFVAIVYVELERDLSQSKFTRGPELTRLREQVPTIQPTFEAPPRSGREQQSHGLATALFVTIGAIIIGLPLNDAELPLLKTAGVLMLAIAALAGVAFILLIREL